MIANRPVALVAGGGRGIGAAIAHRLAEHGYHVEVVARTADEVHDCARSIVGAGGSAHAVPCDVTRDEDVARLYRDVVARHGRMDVLVCAAGRARLGGVRSVAPADLSAMLAVHLVAPYTLVYRFADLLESTRATVVIIGSRAGNVPTAGALAYGVSKVAVGALVRGLARDLPGARLLAVNPGAVDTRLRREAVTQEPPGSKLATPDSIADVVWGLIAIDNPAMTGAVVDVPW